MPSQARDPARHATLTAEEPAGQLPMLRFGTPYGVRVLQPRRARRMTAAQANHKITDERRS